jgi:hypothetical protein
VVGVGGLQLRHPILKAAWDIGVRNSEKGSKISHRASRGKAMHRTLGGLQENSNSSAPAARWSAGQIETLKIGACCKL